MIYLAVYRRSAEAAWPEDAGDDPSFIASRCLASRGGALTWGVCRQDVRNVLGPGDLVVFFAADRLADRRPDPGRYSFVAFATVQRKVSQLDIWRDPALEIYREYQNLLIRPAGDRFEHFEPGLPPRRWHDDWYWRITTIDGCRKSAFDHVQRRGHFLPGESMLPRIACNYVLFAPEGPDTMILADPPMRSDGRRDASSHSA